MARKPQRRKQAAAAAGASPLVRRARAALAAGRLADAARLARQALTATPGDAQALHVLGATALREGAPAQALQLLCDALARKPDDAEVLVDHGEALRASGDFEAALASCRRAVQVDSESARAWTGLGLAGMAAGRREEGVPALRRALELAPRSGEVAMHLANAAHECGDLDLTVQALAHGARCKETALPAQLGLGGVGLATGDGGRARAAFEAALRLAPGHPRAQLGLAMVDEQAGEHAAALRRYRALVTRDTRDIAAWQGIGRAAAALRLHDEAVEAARHLLDTDPGDVACRVELARALTAAGQLDAAMEVCTAGLALGEDARLCTRRGHLLALRGATDEAREVLLRARHLAPDDAEAAKLLGEVLMQQGHLDGAAEQFRAALAIAPGYDLAWESIGLLPRRLHRDGDLQALRHVIEAGGHGPMAGATLQFALAALLEASGDFDGACAALDTANAIVHGLSAWDQPAEEALIEALLDVDAGLVRSLAAHGHASDVPLFIVGMPRSGTTLLEQMLGCHSQVHAAGEVLFFNRVRVDLCGETFPASLRHLDSGALQALGERYLAMVTPPDWSPARITDKLPANFLRLPLIAAVFPNARIVHLKRNAEDVCLSVYRQNFTAPEGNAWAYSLRDIAAYHAGYRRIMAHWPAVMGEHLLEVEYETLVAEPESTLRRVLAHARLPWEPACLDFSKSKSAVRTASVTQVREPLHRRNVGRAHRYPSLLARLREEVQALG